MPLQRLPTDRDEATRIVMETRIEAPANPKVDETGEENGKCRLIRAEPPKPALVLPTPHVARGNRKVLPIAHALNETRHRRRRMGEVAVHPANNVPACDGNPMLDTPGKPVIRHASLNTHVWSCAGNFLHQPPCLIGGIIVNDDDLFGIRDMPVELCNEVNDIFRLVVCREDDGDLWQRHGRHRRQYQAALP